MYCMVMGDEVWFGSDSCLPAITQNIDSSGEDTEQDNEEGGVAVFSRSHHLTSLGMRDSFLPPETSQHKKGEECEREAAECTESGGYTATKNAAITDSEAWHGVHTSTEADGAGETQSKDSEWDQFKTDFIEKLRSSNYKVRCDTEDYAVEQHLLMKAFSELQSSEPICGPEAVQHHNTTDSNSSSQARNKDSTLSPNQQGTRTAECMCMAPDGSSTAPSSGSIQSTDATTGHVSLLSTSTLSRIEMSALDRALEEVETNFTKDEKSLEHHPLPKLAWEESNSADKANIPDLMSQLTALSGNFQSQEHEMPKQQRQIKGMSKTPTVITESSPQKGDGEEGGKKTVYIDLQPTYNNVGRKKLHHKQ